MACSADSEVFDDPELRKALTHAIDRDLLVSTYYRGFAMSATLPASPESAYYDEELAEQYGYNGEKFAQAVADAALENPTITLLVNGEEKISVEDSSFTYGMFGCGSTEPGRTSFGTFTFKDL